MFLQNINIKVDRQKKYTLLLYRQTYLPLRGLDIESKNLPK